VRIRDDRREVDRESSIFRWWCWIGNFLLGFPIRGGLVALTVVAPSWRTGGVMRFVKLITYTQLNKTER